MNGIIQAQETRTTEAKKHHIAKSRDVKGEDKGAEAATLRGRPQGELLQEYDFIFFDNDFRGRATRLGHTASRFVTVTITAERSGFGEAFTVTKPASKYDLSITKLGNKKPYDSVWLDKHNNQWIERTTDGL